MKYTIKQSDIHEDAPKHHVVLHAFIMEQFLGRHDNPADGVRDIMQFAQSLHFSALVSAKTIAFILAGYNHGAVETFDEKVLAKTFDDMTAQFPKAFKESIEENKRANRKDKS